MVSACQVHVQEDSMSQDCLTLLKTMQVMEKHITLPPLCSCPHELSPLNPQYPQACAINCPLFSNAALYSKLLQSLLYNYDL